MGDFTIWLPGDSVGVGRGAAASETWGDPVWCVVKGISDFADENRDSVIEANRPVACRNASLFVLSALSNDARRGESLSELLELIRPHLDERPVRAGDLLV